MDSLNYFRNKYGYNRREGAYTTNERLKKEKAQADWDWQLRELERKRRFEEEMKKKEVERREREKRNTNIDALRNIADPSEQVNPINRLLKLESPSYEEQKAKHISHFTGFTSDLRKDIMENITMQKAIGTKDEDIKKSLIPPEDNSIKERLNYIASKIKPGEEKLLYNIKEGWHEREIQNMLSKEYVRKMNGLPNNVDLIEEFLRENPEISAHESNDDNIIRKFFSKGVRFLGSGTRLQYDSYKESAKDPMSYVWAGTILAASIMAAPVTGGASLAAAPLAASSPLLVSQMPLLTKTIASLKPLAALTFGMKHGALKNMAELEAGSAYKEYLEEGIDHRIAAPIATTVGTFNGIIEYMQIDSALSAIPGVTELVENGSKMAQKQLVKEITKVMANYGVDLGSNVIEEMAQAGTAELGLELSRYLQDTPNPRTIDGLKVLGKTMTKEDFWNTVLEEGYGALQSMWLSPIVSSAGRVTVNQTLKGMANTAEKAQITKQLDLEERQTREAIKHDMDYILEKDGATDQAIRMINETRDPRAMEFLMAEQQILEDILQREDATNQDKARIEKTLDKVKNVVSKVMYETKEGNQDMEYMPTNAQDIEQEILSEGFLDNNEVYNESLNNYTIELYKLADNHNVLNTIKEELAKGTNKAEIMDMITKSLPRKMRKPLDVMAMINSVELVQNEIKAQIIMNNLYNLEEIRNNVNEKVVIDETLVENEKEQVVDEDVTKTDLTEDDLREDKDDATPIPSTEDKSLATEPLTTPDNFKDDLVPEETISGEIDTEIEDKSTTKEFRPSDIVTVPIEKINVDPERFQFRYDRGNEGGATKKLVGAEYNPMLAGTILLWQDEYNDLYVVNGHHRVDLAKNSDVKEIDARIISHKEYTAEEARSLGAMINIAEDNASSIDVAKLIRDTGITEADFNDVGIRPNSKIAKDGMALSKLNDWIFTQVATRAIPIERAVIIGEELGDNSDGQNQIIKAIDKIESKGKNITNNILVELIAEVKGTAREEYTEMTLFGEETFIKNYSLERAELVSYVKRQLRDRVSLLKNVSKNKNAAILQELGNTIAVDDNVKEMNVADQALWILDKTLNYQGTKINTLFNELAKEYAEAEPMNKNKVKKKALNELITLMEGGQLLSEVINQEVKREGIKDSIINARADGEGGQQTYGLSESELENQVNLFGEDTIMQLKELPDVKVVADENTKQTTSFKATIPIVEAIKKNPMFNGLTVKYSNESGKVETMSKEDLINHGYGHLEEKGEKYIYGFYNDGNRTITLNQEATRDTILEEAIHDIQYRLEQIDPELAVLVNEWENEVREQAKEHGITIPDGYELLAQSLVYTEFGYASTNPFIANLIAVDDEIVNKFKAILGDDIAERGFGFVDSEVEKSERLLKSKYENHAKRMFTQDGYIKNIIEAENKRKSEIKGELKKARAATYYHPSSGNYVIVHPSVKGHKYQVTYFSPELGPLMDSQFDTVDEVADRLIEDKMYYKANEIHYQLKNQYDRSVADELYERFYLQGGQRKDSDSRTSGTNVSVEISGRDIREIRKAINEGNFTLKDYQELIEGNENLAYDTRKYLKELVDEAKKKGLDRPNKEVSLKQFLYRFYGAEIGADTEISDNDIRKYWLYSIDRAIDKKDYFDESKDMVRKELGLKDEKWDEWYDTLTEMEAERMGIENVKRRLKAQHRYFQDKIDTYRHRGLQYQIKPMDEKVNSPEFKQWFGDSKVVDEKGNPLTVYHGSLWKYDAFKGNMFFFSESEEFARGYAEQKGFEQGIDNDKVVYKVYLSSEKLFDISDEESSSNLYNALPKSVEYGVGNNKLSRDEFIERLKGNRILKPFWTKEQIDNAKYAEYIGQSRDGYNNDVFIGTDGNEVLYAWNRQRDILKLLSDVERNQLISDGSIDVEYYEVFNQPTRTKEEAQALAKEMGANPWQIETRKETIKAYRTSMEDTFLTGQDNWTYYELSDALDVIRELGYDGIKMQENGAINYLVFNPTQIKSIDNVGTFSEIDPNIYYQLKDDEVTLNEIDGTDSDLLAMHNITVGNLEKAIKLGGFPMPSIAITKKDIPFTDFGGISLIFDKETIDPQNELNKVFGGDAWTPIFPDIKTEIKFTEKHKELIAERNLISDALSDEDTKALTLSIKHDIIAGVTEKERIKNLANNDYIQYMYLVETGKLNDYEYDMADNKGLYLGNKITSNAALYKGVIEYAEKFLDEIEIEEYAVDKVGNIYPANIDGILQAMAYSNSIRDAAGTHGATKLIVNALPEYKTLDEIRADSNRLTTKEYDASDTVSKIITRYSKGIREYLKPDTKNKYPNSDYFTFVAILNNLLDKWRGEEFADPKMNDTLKYLLSDDFNNIPDEYIESILDVAIYLQNTPTDMFESKPQRAVGLNEIQAAAINVLELSRSEIQKAEELLSSIGINVIEKYTGRYESDRQRAMNEILRQKDLTFQIKETDTNTKEFKDWFADSKIVDEEGKPIKAYHGTIQKFSSFKAGDIGFHFGNKDQAMDRIDDLTGDISITDEPLIDENVMPVYLNIKNPIRLDIDLGNWNANYRLTDVLLERGFLTEEEAREVKEIKNYDMEGYTSNANKKLREILMAKGYDGIVYDNWFESEGDSYIAFHPNQIKSAYNEGAWNINNPNIYYQLKDEADLRERSWGQTIRDSDIVSQELKDLLTSNKFMYEIKHNKDTILAAAKLIDEKGEAWVEARLLSELENDAVLFAASQILTYKYMETGELDRAMAMLDKTAEKATSAGQAIQILSVWGRQTPDGMLRYTANRFSKAITEEQKQKVIETTNKLKTEFNKINQEALNNIDITGAIKAVDEMPLQELVTRKLAKSKEGQGLIDKYGLENILKTLENKEMKEIAEIDREILKPFLDGKTSIDDSMADKIVEVVNEHYKEGKGNLKNKLSELGLNDFEVEILHMYIKNQMKEYAKDKKMSLIDELPRQKYERKGIDQQILDLIADGEIDENILKNLVGEKEGLPVLSKDLIDYIYQQGQHINSLEEGSRERDVATAKLMSEIASHMPTNFWNKIATIQTMAHLLNVRTTLRNLIGNELFSKIDTITHNYLGAPIDKLVSVKTKQRTAIHRNIFKLLQTQYKGYGEGFRLGLEDALMGIDTFDEKSKFEIKRTRTFNGGVFGTLETVLNITMRATDRAAFTAAFMDSIEEQMKIAGVNAPTEQMIDNATALGLYRTFNDETALSEAFRGGKRALNKFSSYITGTTDFGLGDLVLKYPSTPANILARAVDYSPVGVITTMLELYKDTSGDSYIRQKMAVEGLSRALAGTSLIATGMILAKMGVITGSDSDDDEDIYKLQKQYGLKDYSVNVSAIKRHFESGFKNPTAGELKHGDTLATYDWIEPMAIPLAVGADTVLGKGDALSLLDTIVNATEKGVTALAEQPLLTGLTRLFGYGDPVEGVSSAVLDIPSSFTPTLLAHIAAFMDGSSKNYYDFYSKGRRAYNAVLNKIPGVKSQLPDKFSVLGEKLRYYPEDTGAISRILRTIVSPANHGKYEPSEEAQFIFDLYEKTGMTEHIPRKLQKSYTIDGAKYTFTPEEYEKLSKWTGEEVRKRISYALNTYMGGWSPEEQVDEIRWIINELGKEAKEKFIEMKGIEQ